MSVPTIKKLNTCTAIQYGSHVITKVFYSDSNQLLHQVWPNSTVIENLSIVKLDTRGQEYDIATTYTIDANTNQPTILLLPDVDYAVKGDIIRRENGNVVESITDCYLTTETIGSQSQYSAAWSIYGNDNVNGTIYSNRYPKQNGNNINTSTPFTVFRCDNNLYSGDPYCVPQMHYLSQYLSGITGFVFDDNYKSPLILKRITISADVMLFDDSSNTSVSHRFAYSGGITQLSTGQSITVWPKLYKTGTNYSIYEAITGSFTGGTGYVTVTDNNNGSYTINAVQASNSDVTLTFNYSVNGQTLTENFSFGVISNVDYGVRIGNSGSYSFVAGNQSGTIAVTEPTSINVVQSNDGGTTYSSYSGSFTVTSGNSNIISVSGNNIIPVGTGQTTVTVTVNGTSWVFTVNATYNVYMVHNLEDYGNETFTNFNENKTININSVGPYIIGFSTSSSNYNDAGVSIQKRSGGTWNQANVQDGTIEVYVSGSGSGSVIFDVTLANGSTYSVTINVSVS